MGGAGCHSVKGEIAHLSSCVRMLLAFRRKCVLTSFSTEGGHQYSVSNLESTVLDVQVSGGFRILLPIASIMVILRTLAEYFLLSFVLSTISPKPSMRRKVRHSHRQSLPILPLSDMIPK